MGYSPRSAYHPDGLSQVRGTVLRVYSEEGIAGLWAGGAPTCLRVGIGCGIYFSCLELCLAGMGQQQRASHSDGTRNPTASFIAGATARFVAAVLTNPSALPPVAASLLSAGWR